MEINIHIHHHNDLKEIINQNIQIMASIKELTDKVEILQTELDSEQEQITAAIAKLQATIDELQAGSAGGGTEAERQALADKLDSIISDLKGTIPDEEPQP